MKDKIKNHPILQNANEIAEICQPLRALNINYFSHAHIDHNKQFTGICNNPSFAEMYFSKKYYEADIHMAGQNEFGNIIIWDAIECQGQSKKLNEDAAAFGVKHTFTITEKDKDGNNYYHFSSDLLGKSINQEYIRNLELLKLFIVHFRNKISQSCILTKAYEIKFTIDDGAPGYTHKLSDTIADASRESFLNAINLNKKEILKSLTIRETEILYWLHRGKTMHQIALILDLSEITVNKHIATLKEKTHCYTQFQLGEFFSSFS